jgi:hypothetical protein
MTVPDLLVLKRFSRVERVTGIEPALSAWEEFLSHRILLSCKGIRGLNWPLVTPTGLVVWPACGPDLGLVVVGSKAQVEILGWRRKGWRLEA